jgi:hypothetical protein
MAHDVFISYSSKDKPTADAICAILESKEIRAIRRIKPPSFLPNVPALVLLVRQLRRRYPIQIGGAQYALLSHRSAQLNVGMGARPTRQLIPTLQAIGQGSFRQGLAAVPQDRMIGLDAAFHRDTPVH